jgi:coniferyl-aldehyde dehydrogenase
MTVAVEDSPVIDTANTLDQQRRAFLNDGPPGLKRRRANLVKLRAVVLAHRREVEDAISTDFGNRSRHETDIMELLGVVQSIDYLLRHLRRFMKPERRHVAAFHRAGRAYVEYQPKGVIGVMAPWNYPFSLTFIPLALRSRLATG